MEGTLPRTGPSAVVLEFGGAFVKCGFAGEASPRVFLPSNYFPLSPTPSSAFEGAISTPQLTESDWEDALTVFVHDLYYNHLQINPHERAVVLCESLYAPQAFREALSKVLYDILRVPSILFVVTDSVITLPLRQHTALIIDSGAFETRVTPLFDDALQTHAITTALLAGASINQRLALLLRKRGNVLFTRTNTTERLSDTTVQISQKTLNDIKVRLCSIPSTPLAPVEGEAATSPGSSYPLGADTFISIDSVTRRSAPQVLFELDDEDESVATAVLDSLLKCPYDTRCRLAQRILLVGGTAMMRGFDTRLIYELNALVATPRYAELKGLSGQFDIIASPFPVNFLGWLGGSIVGCVEHKEAITLKQYQEKEPLPDWTRLRSTEDPAGIKRKGPFELTPTPFTNTSSTAALSASIFNPLST